jgi:hypothetical protein
MIIAKGSCSSRWDAVRLYAWRLNLDPEPLIAEATHRGVTPAELGARFDRSIRLTGAPLETRLAADAMTPGLLYIELLWQDTHWVDRLGRIWQIDSPAFTTHHLLNVVLMLREAADDLYRHFPTAHVLAGNDAAAAWLSATPLMRGLKREIDRRATASDNGAG